uniref:tRNA (uracil(54)-C(5))-methyltransferase n=1 Tax=Ixodes ricinus TaxID=34613 RepID=V5HTR6_IXORI
MFKYQDLTVVLQKLGRKLSAAGVNFPADPKGLPCPLRPVVPSPVLEGYRNKDEFSIREGPSGEPKVVGFLVGSPTGEGKAVCVSPDHVIICKESHKRVARAFQRYIQRSPLAGCYETNFQGHWKNVVVRSNSRDEVMAIVVMHPQQLTQEQLIAEKQGLVDYFVHGEGKDCNIASLYFQACPHTRCSHEQAPFELLHGQPHLQEEMGDLRFRLSPESFFQVNSAVAGFMYDAVRQMLDCNQHSTLPGHLFAGTGTIGLYDWPGGSTRCLAWTRAPRRWRMQATTHSSTASPMPGSWLDVRRNWSPACGTSFSPRSCAQSSILDVGD